MLAFVGKQIGCEPGDLASTRNASETRREHLGELQTYLDVRSFRRDDKRAVAHVAIEQAIGSDRGDVIVSAMIEYLRERRILLPAAVTLEKIALAARALLANAPTIASSKACRQDDRGIGSLARRRRRRRAHAARLAAGMAGSAASEEPCRSCRSSKPCASSASG